MLKLILFYAAATLILQGFPTSTTAQDEETLRAIEALDKAHIAVSLPKPDRSPETPPATPSVAQPPASAAPAAARQAKTSPPKASGTVRDKTPKADQPVECKTLGETAEGAYTGGCKDGLAEGFGVVQWRASTYQGMFAAGLRQGQGTYLGQKAQIEGTWTGDKVDGPAVITLPDGRVYQGEYDKGTPSGEWAPLDPDRKRIEGEHKDSLFLHK